MNARPERSLKVLIVAEPGEGGVFRHVEGLVQHLLKQKVRVHFAYSDKRSSHSLAALVEQVRSSGGEAMNLRVVNRPSFADLPAIINLRRFIRRIRPDIVHGHSSKAGVLVRLATVFGLESPVIYTPHAYYGMSRESKQNRVIYSFVESALGHVGSTINISQDEAAFGLKVLGIPAKRQRIIANPVDCERFHPPTLNERIAARARLGLSPEHIAIGIVGRMCWQKDPETAYKAFLQVAAKNPRLQFLHLGWGKWKEYLLSLAREKGLENRVRIFDYMEEPASFYHGLDSLLISSRYEAGWPFVVLEAMACGLPIIGANCPGMENFGTTDLNQVYPFPPENIDCCAAQITHWLEDLQAGKMENNHRNLALTRFSPEVCFGAVLDHYFELAKARNRETAQVL